MNNKKKNKMAKTFVTITDRMLSVAANSRCMLIYHQPKQPEKLKNFLKF